ncbi:MAG TPA: hypothetical protein ENN58_04605 [bacterium]|nr:hypothetical protein [bacterium]
MQKHKNNNERWEAIYSNVINEGSRIKKRRKMTKIFSGIVFTLIFSSVIFFATQENKRLNGAEDPAGYAYTDENDVEIALIAQGVFFDGEFGLLME